MKFNPGDNVSFINEKQDGTVVKTLNNGKVIVSIEDGFDIEVFEKELVLKRNAAPTPPPEISSAIKPTSKIEIDATELINLCEPGSVCLAAVPSILGAVLTGKVQYHVVNNSGYSLQYTFYAKEHNKWKGITHGVVEHGKNSELLEIKREDLIDLNSFLIQGLLFNEAILPGSGYFRKETNIVLPDLNIIDKEAKGVSAYAKITILYAAPTTEDIDIKDLFNQYNKSEKKNKSLPVANKLNQIDYAAKGILLNEKQVDLHIEELKKDISGLSNSDMIQIQLSHFHSEMSNAMRNHFKRIIFIHGVGNGKLKQVIRENLRQYPGVAFKDADQLRYGNGATEVIFE